MFEAKVKAEVLKEVVDVVSTLGDEAKFNIGKDAVTVKAVDPAHVAMVDLSLDRAAFDGYKADEGELGIDMDKMKEILRLAKSGDVISLVHDEAESISDHIALKASSAGFEIVSEGDTDSVSHVVPKELLEELQCKDAVRSLFPLDYFSNMVKAIGSSPATTLFLGTDYPVKMEFKIAGGKGEVRFLLAPRIESD